MINEFLESTKSAKEFIEDTVMSSDISSVTDKDPDTRIIPKEDDNLTK
jgi:hypothetical protein